MENIQHKIKMTVLSITFVLVLVTGIIFNQKFILMIPLFISVFVMAFQANVNRYAYLAGGLNSFFYGLVYIYLGLYASAVSAILVSAPMQIMTFINWQRKAYKNSVVLKKMSAKTRALSGGAFLMVWLVGFGVLSLVNSEYALLDNTASLLGILVSVLTMLAYVEYTYLWLVSASVGVLLNAQVFMTNPGHITYLVYSVYALFSVVLSFINVRKLYLSQQEESV